MRISLAIFSAILSLAAAGCRKDATPQPATDPLDPAKASAGSGETASSETASGETASGETASGDKGAPVETGRPNVPEFKPAFDGQTRAPAIKTTTPLQVTKIVDGFDKPWAVAFLPNGHMLITEKIDGKLFLVAPDGKKSPEVSGVPKVDGGGQGGLLDVVLDPNYTKNQFISAPPGPSYKRA